MPIRWPEKRQLEEPLYEYSPTFLKECRGYNQARKECITAYESQKGELVPTVEDIETILNKPCPNCHDSGYYVQQVSDDECEQRQCDCNYFKAKSIAEYISGGSK